MKLTERQCWDTLRDMVRAKNDEYSGLLYSLFDAIQMREVLGFTRDTFLYKMGFSSFNEFNKYIKSKNKTVASQWLDNLSSEDLLLFLDFRCRYLQEIYNYYELHGAKISRDIIKKIVEETKISKLKGYNYGRLRCSGKPNKIKCEKKLEDMYLQSYDIQSKAIKQTLERMAFDYQDIHHASYDRMEQIISQITTSNRDLKGNLTGHRFNGKLEGFAPEEEVSRPKFVGLDIQGTPVYDGENGYYTSLGRKLEDDEFIYNQNEIDTLGL